MDIVRTIHFTVAKVGGIKKERKQKKEAYQISKGIC